MSRRNLRADDEEGFLRAWRDEVLDLVATYPVRIEFLLCVPVRQPGMLIRVVAYHKDAQDAEQVYAVAEQPYPTHAATRLHAALYRAAIRIAGAIVERRRTDRGENSSAPAESSE